MTSDKRRQRARQRFRPKHIRLLFIAEAPPSDSERFFYFEDVTSHDSLYLEMIKVLYPSKYESTGDLRARKPFFVNLFKRDGMYLVDAVDAPFEQGARSSHKKSAIKRGLPALKKQLKRLCKDGTKVILISAPVYNICFDVLRNEGFCVINKEMIPFPGSHHQQVFREKLAPLVAELVTARG